MHAHGAAQVHQNFSDAHDGSLVELLLRVRGNDVRIRVEIGQLTLFQASYPHLSRSSHPDAAPTLKKTDPGIRLHHTMNVRYGTESAACALFAHREAGERMRIVENGTKV